MHACTRTHTHTHARTHTHAHTHAHARTHTRMPTLVTPKVHLPNFFMPPHELEQSMRSLRRACVLSRPPPRTQVASHDPDKRTAGGHVSTKQAFRTLREVNQYLESRRAGGEAQTRELSASQTQRIARIFSSKPAHTH